MTQLTLEQVALELYRTYKVSDRYNIYTNEETAAIAFGDAEAFIVERNKNKRVSIKKDEPIETAETFEQFKYSMGLI